MDVEFLDLITIRKNIKQQQARWIAGETSVSRLAPDGRRALLLPGPPARVKPPLTALLLPPPPPPASFDWRNVAGRSYVTSVKQQIGSTCVAFANTAALESCVLKSERLQGDDIDLSEHTLVASNPGYPGTIAEFLQSTGLPPEGCYPWDQGAPSRGWEDQAYRVIEQYPYSRLPIQDVKALTATDGPIVTGMNVPADFLCYQGGIYTATMRPGDNSFHEVLVIGYDDSSQCFICKNSWGEDWGEAGFFRISYNQFANGDVDFGVLVGAYAGVIPPRQRTMSVPIALRTFDGHYLTAVNGGGLGEPAVAAMHTDAVKPGPWETFSVEWLDTSTFALRTANGNYVTAMKGGGVGGPNDASNPVHTDASWVGPWEELTLNYDAMTATATIQTPNGRYLTAVGGGGVGGPDSTPIHTDATAVGPWEKFYAVIAV